MRSQSSPLPWVIPCALLLFLTLRPVRALQAALDSGLAPVRKIGELAAPLVLLGRLGVDDSEAQWQSVASAERMAGEALLKALAKSALPTEAGLQAGRRIVHGAVIGRVPEQRDMLRVELRDMRGVRPGYPVACGNAYVGRVQSLLSEKSIVLVALVTGSDFHVGGVALDPEWEDGQLDPRPVQMTVGGIFSPESLGDKDADALRLAVDHPSDRAIVGGLVRVDERYGESPELQALSLGLHLGKLSREKSTWGIEPELDYQDGLFQVVVLCPLDPGLESNLPFESASQDDQWLRVRPIGLGDPSPYRQGAKIRAGQSLGVHAGAAVISRANQLVGRVSQAGPWTSNVSLLEDPGFSVVAVAMTVGSQEPYVLGRLVSLGRQPRGAPVRLQWHVRVSPHREWRDLAGAEGKLRARLYTGSGEQGLPSGFAFGDALIPLDVESGARRIIELEPPSQSFGLQSLFVRTSNQRPVAADSEAERH